MQQSWDERYSAEEYIYGTQPNDWFREVVDRLSPGRALIPGAGEGRDAVYAARKGWKVMAFDHSRVGKKKAELLCRIYNVSVDYRVVDAFVFSPGNRKFDLIGMTFFHLPLEFRTMFHRKAADWLAPDGLVVIEAFHPLQLNYSSGGPKDPQLLISTADLTLDFEELSILENRLVVRNLCEGTHHRGLAAVVQFLARKA